MALARNLNETSSFNSLSDFDKGWIVGIIEGEGCPYLHRRKVKNGYSLHPRLHINMTDKDTVERYAALIGHSRATVRRSDRSDVSKPYNKKHFKVQWRYDMSGKHALLLMLDIFPYMSQRRKQRIQDIILDYGGGK